MLFLKIKELNFITLYVEEKGMPLVMKNKISQMTTTTKPEGPYTSYEIFHKYMQNRCPISSIALRIPFLKT